jgi:hypothetical protein
MDIPTVGHRDNVAVQHVEPLSIAYVASTRTGQGMSLMFIQPPVKIEVVILLAPQHSGQRLTMHAAFVFTQRRWSDALIKFVGIGQPRRECLVK